MKYWFFFSSRRRHTTFKCDWSSDVCSSDLVALIGERRAALVEVAGDRLLAVVDVARRDDLVARVAERLHRHVELVAVLGLHVLAHDLLAGLSEAHAPHPI